MVRNVPGDPDTYFADEGDVIRVTVSSVNFSTMAFVDTDSTLISQSGFEETREFRMGASSRVFVVSYRFPDPVPAGGFYRRTVASTATGFVDGPLKVTAPSGSSVATLGYAFLAPSHVPADVFKHAGGK